MSFAPYALRSNYSALFGPGMLPVLEDIVMYEFEQYPMVRDQIFDIVSTDRDIWQSTELLDLPLFDIIPEGTEYSNKRASPGYNATLTPVKYGSMFSVSKELVDDGKFDMIAMLARKMAKSARETQEVLAMDVFNNAFTTQLTPDGLSLINAAHTWTTGGTFSNRLAVDSDLSESSLQAALAQWERSFAGNSGILNRIKPRVLLVSPENKRYATELVGSELKADTSDNNLNSIRVVDGLRVVSSPHLTDPDAWFILGAPQDTGLKIIRRQGLQTAVGTPENVGFLNDAYVYKGSYRETVGAINPFSVMGTPGA